MSRADDVPAAPDELPPIPTNWALPAQDTAKAAGVTSPPRPRDDEEIQGHPLLWLLLLALVAYVAWAVTDGWLSPDHEPTGEGFSALAPASPPAPAPAPDAPVAEPAPDAPAAEPAPAAVPSADPSFPSLPSAQKAAAAASPEGTPSSPPPEAAPAAGPASDAPVDDAETVPVRRKARKLVRRAEKRIELGNHWGAKKLIDRALTLDPDNARGQRARGVVCAATGDGDCARAAYRRYLELRPDAPDAPDVRRILGQ
jgi:tetratricopeptide (TPR) repeat protein